MYFFGAKRTIKMGLKTVTFGMKIILSICSVLLCGLGLVTIITDAFHCKGNMILKQVKPDSLSQVFEERSRQRRNKVQPFMFTDAKETISPNIFT